MQQMDPLKDHHPRMSYRGAVTLGVGQEHEAGVTEDTGWRMESTFGLESSNSSSSNNR